MTIPAEPTVVVGIFDQADDLNTAGERLASEGLEKAVYDETIAAEPFGTDSAGPIPAHPARISRVIAERLSNSRSLVQEFTCRLSDHRLPEEAIEAYAIAFRHKGKFLLVETDAIRADRAADILRDARAARVDRHG